MMYSLPLRRTILLSAVRFLRDVLTFITRIKNRMSRCVGREVYVRALVLPGLGSLVAEGDPPFGEVVGGHLHFDPVAGEDADVMEPHLA